MLINLKYAQKNEEIFKGSESKFAKFKALKASQKDKSKEMKAVLDKGQLTGAPVGAGDVEDLVVVFYYSLGK